MKINQPNVDTRTCGYCLNVHQTELSWKVHLDECNRRPLVLKEPTEKPKEEPKKEPTEEIVETQNLVWIIKRKNIQCVLNLSTIVPFGFIEKYYCFYCFQTYDDNEALFRHTRITHPVCSLESIAITQSQELSNKIKVNVVNLA